MSTVRSDDNSSGLLGVPERRYLTVEELSKATTLSVSTLRRRFKEGSIVGFQPGGRGSKILFPIDAIEKIQCQPPSIPAHRPPAGPSARWRRGLAN